MTAVVSLRRRKSHKFVTLFLKINIFSKVRNRSGSPQKTAQPAAKAAGFFRKVTGPRSFCFFQTVADLFRSAFLKAADTRAFRFFEKPQSFSPLAISKSLGVFALTFSNTHRAFLC